MRTFQFSDAKSHKFWNIDVSGNSFTVTYGKIGTAGQTQTKSFPTPAKALEGADKLIKEKTGKGYVETTPKAAGTGSAAEAFEKALIADPYDGTGWRAFADYLVEQDDPRGEFMQVQLALEDEARPTPERKKLQAREKALLKKHERDWLGSLAPFILDQKPPERSWRPSTINYRFRHGWLSELEIPQLGVEFTRALLLCKEARFLYKLHVHTNAYEYPEGHPQASEHADSKYAPGPDLPKDVSHYEVSYHLLARFPYFASVRVFHLGNPIGENFGDSDNCHTNGEMAFHYVKQMPHAEEIYLLAHGVDAGKLFAHSMPNLRVLQVFHNRAYPTAKLAGNTSLRNLTHLRFQPHAPDDPDEVFRLKDLRPICRSANLPKLSHLVLRCTAFGDEGVTEVITSGLLKRLKVLDLSAGCVTDEGAKVLAASPDAKNLEQLNLDTNTLSTIGIKALQAAKVKFSAKTQHNEVPPFDFEDEIPEFLYTNADIE
ncbi:MAG: WGR domain-containing protein [Planctomycetes bacterium]|nr:WGR domain-containing protein [Planctomycetota bacterium]